jgi:hypothetical protein
MKQDKETYCTLTPTLVVRQGKEALAESSRKPKAKRAEDLRDPETVAGMKCQMDIKRERGGKKTTTLKLRGHRVNGSVLCVMLTNSIHLR